jgi:shikimate kinase
MPPAIVLIGSPGAGKSSVGRRVAERLDLAFEDTDHIIEAATGMSISDIFVTQGEDEFRRLEAQAVKDALTDLDGVLALGGGAVMLPETQHLLRGRTVVWLKVSLTDAVHRVGMNQARPLLLGNVRGTLMAMLEKRNPVYADVASVVIDTSGKSQREVVDEVVEAVRP